MSQATAPIRHTDRFYIGGQWVAPSSDAKISVIDSDTEQVYFTVPEAQAADISRAVDAAREAFDNGPWPWLTHEQRAEYLRAIGAELGKRAADIGEIWPRESGVLHAIAQYGGAGAEQTFRRVRRAREHLPLRGAGQAVGRAVRPAGARAGRRRRGDRPVERADDADQQ
jgi:acyl-CoA reductase-like NAD-dependent aldehyde dehydrogenase